jgi:methionine--tRNA ligase beta chain
MRRRGYPADALRLFCERVGISKADNNIDMSVLEDSAREILDSTAPRALAIVDPLKVTITNWAPGSTDTFIAERHSKVPELGSREIPFGTDGSVFIDRDDFFDAGADGALKPPKGYKRLVAGGQVRLKFAYVITCDEVVRDAAGKAVELRCTYDPATRAGVTPEGSKRAKGIIQWVSQQHAVKAELRLYDRLFSSPSPGKEREDGDFLKDLNAESLVVVTAAVVEPSIVGSALGSVFQFERVGYFCLDSKLNQQEYSASDTLVFNRVVTLKDTWASTVDAPASASAVAEGSQKQQKQPQQDIDRSKIEDIRRLEMRVGTIISAERHPDADSLYVEQVDCGDAEGPRTIISGLVKHIPIEQLPGRKVVVLCNLKPSKMRGILSSGMLLAASVSSGEGDDAKEIVELVNPPADAPNGEIIRVTGFEAPDFDEQLKSKTQQAVWTRVAEKLRTNSKREATFDSSELTTSCGPCTVPSLEGAVIR